MKKVAIIDLGSNSVRMTIARINSDGTTNTLYQNKKTVRLSEGMGEDMRLKTIPINRTIDALSEFNNVIKENCADEVIAIATAAVRKAANQEYFLDKVKNSLGLEIKVIDGNAEAVYDYLGVVGKMDIGDCVIVDIGGGSTEIILVKNLRIVNKTSIPIGSVSISEKFLQEKESPETIELAKEFVNAQIGAVDFLKDVEGFTIVGLGGGLRTIAKINIKDSDINEILHGHEISADRVFEIYNMLIQKSVEERKLINGVGEERADIIVGGMLPILSIIETISAKKLIISDSGVRDGILFERVGKMFVEILKSCAESL